MLKEELQKKTCKELRDIAKELAIIGRWKMVKAQLIDSILEKSANKSSEASASGKQSYIKTIQNGVLVAFTTKKGKVKTAKVMSHDDAFTSFDLETEYGAKYFITDKDILWVRTGKRWPKGIYQMLKGLVK